jgi:UDP-N-acetylglucosamine:LPS N-acetylglucosamine transferase
LRFCFAVYSCFLLKMGMPAAKQAAAEGRQDELTPRALANWLLHKAENRYSLAEMSRRMSAMGMPDAAAKVADLVEQVAKK